VGLSNVTAHRDPVNKSTKGQIRKCPSYCTASLTTLISLKLQSTGMMKCLADDEPPADLRVQPSCAGVGAKPLTEDTATLTSSMHVVAEEAPAMRSLLTVVRFKGVKKGDWPRSLGQRIRGEGTD
jgi:hypothetical protein